MVSALVRECVLIQLGHYNVHKYLLIVLCVVNVRTLWLILSSTMEIH